MLLLAQGDTAIGERLEAELADVDTRLAQELISDLPCVNSLVAHLEQYRGKMLRPMLVLASAMASSQTGWEVTEPHRVIATVTEIVHLATLVHDDILDEAEIRRRGPTINHLRGNESAVMLGDYLISHAYHLCSSLDTPEPSRVIADTTNTICEGELLQLANRENIALDERTYFEIIRRKTASLCGTCCRLGGVLGGASPEQAADLYDYGEKLGIAYQIVDDVLDLTGSENTVGKTLGRDLQKGKLTLPLIRFLATGDPKQTQKLIDLITYPPPLGTGQQIPSDPASTTASDLTPDLDPARIEQVRKIITAGDSVDYANRWANRLVDQAKTTLESLPESPARSLLMDMAEAVLTRKF